MIEALIFDMDGLLFDSERVVQRSWNIAGNELGFGLVGENIYNTLGMNLKSRTDYFKRVYGADFPMDRFAERTREIYYEIAREEGVPLKPGVRALLEYGKQHGYKMGVATSSRQEHAVNAMKEKGIYDYFNNCVFGDMVENASRILKFMKQHVKGLEPSLKMQWPWRMRLMEYICQPGWNVCGDDTGPGTAGRGYEKDSLSDMQGFV